MKLQKEGNSNARGYCGWHTTWDGINCYLRSLGEYVVACMLDAKQIPYKTEICTYIVDNRPYKPDFFLFTDTTYTRFEKIIEVKSQSDVKSAKYYNDMFSKFFADINIQYEVIFRFDSLKRLYCDKTKQRDWIDKTKNNSQTLTGEFNPMYGVKHRESTKQLIGMKAKQRFENEDYKNNIRQKVKTFFTTQRGEQVKSFLRELRKQEANKRKQAYDQLPDVVSTCKECGNEIIAKKSIDFCCHQCERKWSYQNIDGYGTHKNKQEAGFKRIWTYLNKIMSYYDLTADVLIESLDEWVNKSKADNIIPKNKGLSYQTLLKFNVIEDQNGKIKINYV